MSLFKENLVFPIARWNRSDFCASGIVDCLLLFECREFSLVGHLEPGAFTCRGDFGLFQPFNVSDFNSSFHMLTNKCFVKFVAGQKRLGFASCWVFFEREVNFCFAESVRDGIPTLTTSLPKILWSQHRVKFFLLRLWRSIFQLPVDGHTHTEHHDYRVGVFVVRGFRARVLVVCFAGFGANPERTGPLPTLRRCSPCASWAAPLSGVCAGSATGFPRTAPTCLRAVGVTAPPCPDQRQVVLGARDSSQMLGGLG